MNKKAIATCPRCHGSGLMSNQEQCDRCFGNGDLRLDALTTDEFIKQARESCRCAILNTAVGEWLAEALARLKPAGYHDVDPFYREAVDHLLIGPSEPYQVFLDEALKTPIVLPDETLIRNVKDAVNQAMADAQRDIDLSNIRVGGTNGTV